MKKTFLYLLSMLVSFAVLAQNTNYTNKISTPTQFRHVKIDSVLWMPYGSEAVLRQVGGWERPGAIFCVVTPTDTLLKFWTGERWIDIGGSTVQTAKNELIFGGSVTPLGGYVFGVQEAIYRIDNVLYQSDSGTVTLDSSDATLNRIDRIYLGTDNAFHVLKGESATNALEPQVESDQIGLAFITIPAGQDPYVVTTKIYDENTESVTTNTGTTTDGNNATNVYTGSKSLNVTNLNNNDVVTITKAPPLSTWDVLGFDGISFFIKLKMIMPNSGNLRLRLQIAGAAVSTEVIIPLNKTNITSFQAVTISAAALGNITNTQLTQVRLRYTKTGTNTNFTGFYIDNMFFVDGVTQPNPGNNVTITQVPPTGFVLSPSITVTNSGTWTWTNTGSGGQYYSPSGWQNLPVVPVNVGFIGDRTPNASRGMTIDADSIFLDSASSTNWGVVSPDFYNRVYANTQQYYISPGALIGDSLIFVVPGNDTVTFVKNIVWTNQYGITDSTILIDTTGGGGGGATPADKVVVYTDVDYTVAAGVTHVQITSLASGITITLPSAAANTGREIIVSSTPGSSNSISPAYITDGTTTNTILIEEGTSSFVSDGSNWNRTILGWANFIQDVSSGGGGGGTPIVGSSAPNHDLGFNSTAILGLKGAGGINLSSDGFNVTIDGSGAGGSYTDEQAQDAIGAMVDGTINYTDATPLLSRAALTGAITASAGSNTTALGSFTTAQLNTALSDNDIQPLDADLTTISGLTATTDNFLVSVSSAWASRTPTQVKTTLGLTIGTDVQAFDADLSTWAGVTPGTGVATALAVNIGSAGAPVLFNGAGGTPSSITLTNGTGLPISGITGLASNMGTFLGTASSANLAATLSDEEGSAGGFVRATSPTLTTPTFSGTITTTAAEQTGTNASGVGGIPYVHKIYVRSDETLSNSNADQNLFTNTAHDVITVQANTTYEFFMSADKTSGAVSHSVSLGFLPTTATVTNIEYTGMQWITAVGTQTASQTTFKTKATATTAINAAGANATNSWILWGTITIGATGGTITPQIKFSADPTGTILLKAGSVFKIWAIGNNTYSEQGPIN